MARVWLVAALLLAAALPACAQLSTDDHLADPGFWPTRGSLPRSEYAGSASCAQCHAAKAAASAATPMGRAAMPASLSKILHDHADLSFAHGVYRYSMKTEAGQTVYSVTDGKETLSAPLTWAFGTGRVGQSYLFKREDGQFYEARVTFFEPLKNLEFTPFRRLESPRDLEEAMDRQVSIGEVKRCFACHTTQSQTEGHLDEARLIPGVGCEACHGPGAQHVADMKQLDAGNLDTSKAETIFNARHLAPADSVDYCGACHETWWDVKLSGVRGPSTARSPSFRLMESKCWGGKGDARLTCIACHDPHEQLQTTSASYDHACLNCHVTSAQKVSADHPGKACPVAVKACSSCHMPKTLVPEMHDNFTDHRIRIAKTGEPFPE